jgi:hypothetical protein
MKLISKCVVLLAVCLALFSPSLRYCGNTSFYKPIFAIFCLIWVIVASIALPGWSRVIGIILYVLYRRNLALLIGSIYNIVKLGWFQSVENRPDNELAKRGIRNLLEANFNLHMDFEAMDQTRPSLILANYAQDRLENLACILIPGDIAIVMRDGFKPFLGRVVKWSVLTKSKDCYEETKTAIQNHATSGRSVFAYCTSYHTLRPGYIQKIRSGVFRIAQELNMPVTLLCIDYIETGFLWSIPSQNFRMKSSDTFHVTDVRESMHKARVFFRETLGEFSRRKSEML